MYRWGLPLGCLSLVLATLVGILTLIMADAESVWFGAGVAGLLLYAAIMCVHYFEIADSPGRFKR